MTLPHFSFAELEKFLGTKNYSFKEIKILENEGLEVAIFVHKNNNQDTIIIKKKPYYVFNFVCKLCELNQFDIPAEFKNVWNQINKYPNSN